MTTEFAYSCVLFAGDDGLPMQFNIQYTVEKEYLKSVIEYGGGICTLSDSAIYLVSPGTKVLNVDPSKTLISTRYIFDCVKEDSLLDTDDYRIEINEMEASDFSDSSANMLADRHEHNASQQDQDDKQDSVDIICPNKSSPSNSSDSNHDFDFEDTEHNKTTIVPVRNTECGIFEVPQSTEHPLETRCHNTEKSSENAVSAVPDSLELENSMNMGQNLLANNKRDSEGSGNNMSDNIQNPRASPVPAAVSSSQEDVGTNDSLDNAILNKLKEKPVQDEDSLSQSCTVSSSADAQPSSSPKQTSHHTSAELFNGSSAAPDSASQTTEIQQYIKNLEKEIEEILKKPSPKSIQDKITLVKYISIVKKLPPAIVLKTLQNFQNV